MRMTWNGDKIIADIEAAASEGAWKGAQFLLQESNKGVPHDEGALQRSGTVSPDAPPEATSVFAKAKAGLDMSKAFAKGIIKSLHWFVSYNAPYSRRLHEHPEYNFQNGRHGKWLEIAFYHSIATIKKIVAEEVNKAI